MQKFKLVQFPEAELVDFKKDLEALLNKYSAHLEGQPKHFKATIRGEQGQSVDVWQYTVELVVQKKVETVEVPKDSIASPFVEKPDELPEASA